MVFLESLLRQRGFSARANVIDAGCGTGSHSRALATRGHRVFAIDRSRELLELARAKCRGLDVEVREGELASLEKPGWAHAVLCRGVLNDVLEDHAREAILGRLFQTIRPGGFLLVDVRDWERSAERYERHPLFERSATQGGVHIEFQSETRVDPTFQSLHVWERFVVSTDEKREETTNHFMMRCWSTDELAYRLGRAGFGRVHFASKYGPTEPRVSDDRIVASAFRPPC